MEALEKQYRTYDDDPTLGKDAPSISSLKFISGDKVENYPEDRVTIVYFGAKFDKGSGPIFNQMSKLNDTYKDKVTFLAVFTDPNPADIERFLQKKEFVLNFPACFDEARRVQKAFMEIGKVAALPIPNAFIINKGKIVWHQVFSQNYQTHNSNFVAQLKHVLAGEPLESAGPKPADEVESSSDEERPAAAGGDDGDLALF